MFLKTLTKFIILSTIIVESSAQYKKAADIGSLFSDHEFSCIKSNGFSAIFTQIYSDFNGGSVEVSGSQNVIKAYQYGMGAEVYINPGPKLVKPSYTQFDEAFEQLKKAKINVRTIWLKVTSPIYWYQFPSKNINFIEQMIIRARNRGVTLGIYTNWYDWYQITASTTTFQKYNLPLWYWNAYGTGKNTNSSTNFNDFRTFGGWKSPLAKQYALKQYECSYIFDKSIYQNKANVKKLLINNMTQPLAGSAIL